MQVKTKEDEIILLKEIFHQYTTERKNLLPLLQEIQEKIGYVSPEIMIKVSSYFNIHPNEVYGIISFYDKFRKKPQGLYSVVVCLGTACYLTGGEMILKALERELNIKLGDTTEDKLFSLLKASCFGCCTQAPVIKIKDKIYPRMTAARVEEILVSIKNEISKDKGTE